MNIQIKYKDLENWISVSGDVTFWGDYDKIIKSNLRIIPEFLAPEITTVEWMSEEYDAQHVRWNGRVLQILLTESEIDNFSKLKSASEIEIQNIDTGEVFYLDTQKADYITLEVNQPDNSALWVGLLSFRTNKIYINKNTSSDTDEHKLIITNQDLDNLSDDYLDLVPVDSEFEDVSTYEHLEATTNFDVNKSVGSTIQESITKFTGQNVQTFSQINKEYSFLFLDTLENIFIVQKYITLCNTIFYVNANNDFSLLLPSTFTNSGTTITSDTSEELRDQIFVGMKIYSSSNDEERTIISVSENSFKINEAFTTDIVAEILYLQFYEKLQFNVNIESEKIGKDLAKLELTAAIETTQNK